jgi:hypothetical protein
MSSKRALRRRSCARKNAYADQATADSVAAVARRRRGQRLHVYRCQFGAHWHVGHPPGRVRQSIAGRRRAQDEAG